MRLISWPPDNHCWSHPDPEAHCSCPRSSVGGSVHLYWFKCGFVELQVSSVVDSQLCETVFLVISFSERMLHNQKTWGRVDRLISAANSDSFWHKTAMNFASSRGWHRPFVRMDCSGHTVEARPEETAERQAVARFEPSQLASPLCSLCIGAREPLRVGTWYWSDQQPFWWEREDSRSGIAGKLKATQLALFRKVATPNLASCWDLSL